MVVLSQIEVKQERNPKNYVKHRNHVCYQVNPEEGKVSLLVERRLVVSLHRELHLKIVYYSYTDLYGSLKSKSQKYIPVKGFREFTVPLQHKLIAPDQRLKKC